MYNTVKTMAQTIVPNMHVKLLETIAFLIAKNAKKNFSLQSENLIHRSDLNAIFFVSIYFCRFLAGCPGLFSTHEGDFQFERTMHSARRQTPNDDL